jgi:hypothetical protein
MCRPEVPSPPPPSPPPNLDSESSSSSSDDDDIAILVEGEGAGRGLANAAAREATFYLQCGSWPHANNPNLTPACAGFFRLPYGLVKCRYCGLVLASFEERDSVLVEHYRHKLGFCSFLLAYPYGTDTAVENVR